MSGDQLTRPLYFNLFWYHRLYLRFHNFAICVRIESIKRTIWNQELTDRFHSRPLGKVFVMASAELSTVAQHLFDHPLGCVSNVKHFYLGLIKFYQFAQFKCRQLRTLASRKKEIRYRFLLLNYHHLQTPLSQKIINGWKKQVQKSVNTFV